MPGRKVGTVPTDRPTVLCVEDNVMSQRLLHRAIDRHFAVNVMMAETAEEGVVAALSLLPALMLLDLGLPDADGATVLSALRADKRTSHLPIHVITGDATDRRRLELLESGASGYITKPIDLHLLFGILDSLNLPRV